MTLGARKGWPKVPMQTGRIGLTLANASQIRADRISLIGNCTYPPERPKFDAWGASAKDIDEILDALLSGE